MKKASVLLLALSFIANICFAQEVQKPRIAVIATGGTIAGVGATSTGPGYTSAQVAVSSLLENMPQLYSIADIIPIQLSQVASQNMDFGVLMHLAWAIDSLFTYGNVDGVVVTHGSDTIEESAYFLNLTVHHSKPVVMVGSMRPSTSLSPDGPMNLYNAISLASNPQAYAKGVMVMFNDYILSADDVTKTNTVNVDALECPNYGPLGVMRDGKPLFFRSPLTRHTYISEFDIKTLPESLPLVDIVSSYVGADDAVIRTLVALGDKGIVISGVGHGNATSAIINYASQAVKGPNPIPVVRASRVLRGGVTTDLEDSFEGEIPSWYKSPQKSRILLMLALTKTNDIAKITEYFIEY